MAKRKPPDRTPQRVGDHYLQWVQESPTWVWICRYCCYNFSRLSEFRNKECEFTPPDPLDSDEPPFERYTIASFAAACFRRGLGEELREALSEEAEAAWRLKGGT